MRTRLGWIAPITAIAALALGMAVSRAAPHTERSGLPTDRRPAGSPEAAIREVLLAQQTAWNKGDIPAFLEGYWNSPELTFSGSDGTVRGYDGLLGRYRKSYPDKAAMGELEFSGLEIRVLASDAALVLGHWHLKRVSADVGGVFTLVFQRFPTLGWRIIHDHTSRQRQTP